MRDSFDLFELGWRPCYREQVTDEEQEATRPARVVSHLGSQVVTLTEEGEQVLEIRSADRCGDLAVGDWLLLGKEDGLPQRRLKRQTLVSRRAAGPQARTQAIAANLDTLLIVTSCNHDFSLSRLERYLTLASSSRVTPVIVLTKADQTETPGVFRQRAGSVQPGVVVLSLDARSESEAQALAPWCRPGQTVALVGSSGVGKSTLAMSLGTESLATQSIREDDSKGRHTTTVRSIHPLAAGGLLVDTPGMRELQLADCADGVQDVFEEIADLASRCRFRDCGHQGEPGCAVEQAVLSGTLEQRRLENYRKLMAEQHRNGQSIRQQRHDSRKMGRMIKSALDSKRRRRHECD